MFKEIRKDRSAIIVLGLFLLLALVGITLSILRSGKKKIYTVAKIYDQSGPGKRGATYYFEYGINNQKFKGSAGGLTKWNTNSKGYIYIDLTANDYSDYSVIEFEKVPECMSDSFIPLNGWKDFPKNPCN